MINQPWAKKNWFTYKPTSTFMIRDTKLHYHMPTNKNHMDTTFDINLVTRWTYSKPHYKEGQLAAGTTILIVACSDGSQHQLVNQLGISGRGLKKLTQIDDFFAAMKKARLM